MNIPVDRLDAMNVLCTGASLLPREVSVVLCFSHFSFNVKLTLKQTFWIKGT